MLAYSRYMKSMRARIFVSSVRSFLDTNKKIVVCACVIFVLGIIIGVISAVNAFEGEFEHIPRSEIEYGAAKVFFISALILCGGYVVILISGYGAKTVFLAVVPIILLGVYCGKYVCLLVACYETAGIINLLCVYLPFFIATFVCFMLATIAALKNPCADSSCNSGLRPSFIGVLKMLGINIAINFALFLIIGSMTKVIIVAVY